jgi:tetratricopeptide (TPR) repeat protein
VWRNLAFGYFNVRRDQEKALRAFEMARTLAPEDARIVFEQDQLLKRVGDSPEHRLANLESVLNLVERRDDLTAEYAGLCNQTDRPEMALQKLERRKFQPWEGGEGIVLAHYTRAHLQLGQKALAEKNSGSALAHFQACLNPPENLGETWHLLANQSCIEYWMGVAYEALGEHARAREQWQRAVSRDCDFVQMQVRAVSESTFWSGMALKYLGDHERAWELFSKILEYSAHLERETPKIDYFATSLPTLLLFEEDLGRSQRILALYLRAQACLGLGEAGEARNLLEQVEQSDCNHTGPGDLRAVMPQTTA